MDDTRLLQQLADRAGVIDTVLRAARAMDVQDWPALRACLAATLDVDYSDLRGDPPSAIAADAYVAARITGLAGLKTQHISTKSPRHDRGRSRRVCIVLPHPPPEPGRPHGR